MLAVIRHADTRHVVVGIAAVSLGVSGGVLLWRRQRRQALVTQCCPPGSLPPLSALSAGEAAARGDDISLAGLKVYSTGIPNPERSVIVATDIWGFKAGRHRQVCDLLATSLGCAVYMPDLFHGDPCTTEKGPATDSFAPWVQRFTPGSVGGDLAGLMATLPPASKVGVVGFCWGTFAALVVASGNAQAGSAAVHAACFAHPSHRKIMEKMHGIADVDVGEYYLGAIRVPTMCLTAGNDDPRCKPSGVDEKIIQMAGVATHFEEFETMAHGWIIKGDLGDAEVAKAVPKAVGLMSGWLDQHL